jgi:hypothetical protein
MTGLGCVGATTGAGIADGYISGDCVHPNDAGHAWYSARLYDAMVRLVFIP